MAEVPALILLTIPTIEILAMDCMAPSPAIQNYRCLNPISLSDVLCKREFGSVENYNRGFGLVAQSDKMKYRITGA